MAMQVILKEDVHNLGKAGELVNVKPGYGRNYLIPQGMAVVATAGNVKQIEHEKKLIARASSASCRRTRRRWPIGWRRSRCRSSARSGEEDKLFGSVTSRDIAEALTDKGVTIDHRKMRPGRADQDHRLPHHRDQARHRRDGQDQGRRGPEAGLSRFRSRGRPRPPVLPTGLHARPLTTKRLGHLGPRRDSSCD